MRSVSSNLTPASNMVNKVNFITSNILLLIVVVVVLCFTAIFIVMLKARGGQ